MAYTTTSSRLSQATTTSSRLFPRVLGKLFGARVESHASLYIERQREVYAGVVASLSSAVATIREKFGYAGASVAPTSGAVISRERSTFAGAITPLNAGLSIEHQHSSSPAGITTTVASSRIYNRALRTFSGGTSYTFSGGSVCELSR